MQNNSYTIRWTQITPSTFLYGSQLQFKEDETIFKNALMPSGIVIHEWQMMTQYTADKMIPTLPILKRGQSYHFSFDYEVEPTDHIYFKLIFKRRNGTEAGIQIIKGHEADVVYPKDAFSYVLQMINAAAQDIRFRTITIVPHEGDALHPQLSISEVVNEDQTLPVRNLIFVEAQELSYDAIRNMKNVIGIEHWQQVEEETVFESLSPLVEEFSHLHFIGYHQASNEMAYRMAEKFGGTAFVTYHHAQTTPSFPSRGGTERVVYMDEEKDAMQSMGIVENLLNPSRFLKYININQLNGGRHDEI